MLFKIPSSPSALTWWDSGNLYPPLGLYVLSLRDNRAVGSASGRQLAFKHRLCRWACSGSHTLEKGFSGPFPSLSFPTGAKRMCHLEAMFLLLDHTLDPQNHGNLCLNDYKPAFRTQEPLAVGPSSLE